jgi:hypothetical protein
MLGAYCVGLTLIGLRPIEHCVLDDNITRFPCGGQDLGTRVLRYRLSGVGRRVAILVRGRLPLGPTVNPTSHDCLS